MATPPAPFQCIDPNPDIAGVGVRSSIYAQNILTILSAAIVVFDNDVDSVELGFMQTACNTIMLTACALLVSGFVQTATDPDGLPLYHAVVLLNMSWMSLLHGVTYGLVFLISDAQGMEKDLGSVVLEILRGGALQKREFRHMALLQYTHFSVMGVLGVLVWGSSPTGITDSTGKCSAATRMTLWGVNHSVTSPIVQKISFTAYALAFLPLINFFTLSLTMVIAFYAVNTILHLVAALPHVFTPGGVRQIKLALNRAFTHVSGKTAESRRLSTARINGLIVLGIICFLQTSLIISTEQTISANVHLMKERKEGSWTFGQTLALNMLIFPLTDIALHIRRYPLFQWLRKPMYWLGCNDPEMDPSLLHSVESLIEHLEFQPLSAQSRFSEADLDSYRIKLARYLRGVGHPSNITEDVLPSATREEIANDKLYRARRFLKCSTGSSTVPTNTDWKIMITLIDGVPHDYLSRQPVDVANWQPEVSAFIFRVCYSSTLKEYLRMADPVNDLDPTPFDAWVHQHFE